MTPLDIITLALRRARVLGVGQTVSDDDAQVGFQELNVMMAQWAMQRYMVYTLIEMGRITTGAQSYTVGPGGDYDIPIRPDSIDAAFLRQFPTAPIVVSGPPESVPVTASPIYYQATQAGTFSVVGGTVTAQFSDASGDPTWVSSALPITMATGDGVLLSYTVAPDSITFTPAATTTTPAPVANNSVDYPLKIISAREDFNRIAVKGLQSFAYALFYDPTIPLGRAYPYPYPDSSGLFALHLTMKQPLEKFSNLAEDVNLPPVYEGALVSNLAVILRSTIAGLPPDPLLNTAADEAKDVVRATAGQIPRLLIPRQLIRRGGVYNVYSDRSR